MGLEITRLKRDDNLVDEAQWFDYGGCRLLIARAGNEKFSNEMLRQSRNVRRVQTDNIEKLGARAKRAASKYILINWENVEEDGRAVPYSHEVAYQYFVTYPQFFDKVMQLATDLAADYDEMLEEQAGNSANSSSGQDSSSPAT